MRTKAVTALSLSLLLLTASAQAHDDASTKSACAQLTVFVAKKFYTMDPGRPHARAVAVCNERVVGVGDSLDDLKPWTSTVPTTVDQRLAGKIVFPGFIDAHQHPLLGAITSNLPMIAALDTVQAYSPDIKGVKNEAEAFERMRRFEAELKDPSAPLLVWGWDVPAMGRHLTRQDLDKISTVRPVLVWDASQHHGYVNSAVIAQRKIPNDLKILGVGRDVHGELNGQFLGVPAASYVILPLIAGKLQPAEAMRLMRWLIDLNRRNGITMTTDHSMGIFSVDAEAALLNGMFNNPDTPQRLLAIPAMHSFLAKYGAPDKAIEAVRALQAKSTDRLLYRGVKFFTDDSFNGLTFKPGAGGYIDGHDGLWVTPPEKLAGLMEPWWRDGQQIFVHSIGVEAQEVTIAALRQLQAKAPRFDHRFTFEHVGMMRYDQARALRALGASANVNIYYVWLRGEMYPKVVGTDRAEDLSPLGTLLKAGVPTTVHSDYPIGPPKPLLAITLAMTRVGQSASRTLGAGQAITLDEALRMVTTDAAYVLGIDDKVGSLEPGKLADFTVLERDPHDVKPAAVKDIPIWGTVLGGRVFPATEIRPQ
ncbi:amidohydrolase family protein [Ideonella sp. DXS22W]|uniref:Amidohydrolase family protein n=1 Tax=Pseudaquabacterium inlustre TaxID=2984192 RepID=A0ABU9CLR4_9BURK